MRTPLFWQNPPEQPGWQAHLLKPLSSLYGFATARRVRKSPDITPNCPVICVGNLSAGGTGKTPTVIALIEHLRPKNVHVVSRGYGGTETGPTRVSERRHKAADVGDEPLLIAAFAPTWIAQDRAEGVRAAENDGAEIILLDDGFQNPSVAKSFSIVVVDAALGFGNGRILPAGPLREPVEQGLKRADLLLSIGDENAQDHFLKKWGPRVSVPHATAHLKTLETGMDWQGQRVMAFAGIAHPEKFFTTLRGLGADLIRTEALSDHQPLSDALMKRLEIEAMALSAQLVTTEKDAVRLPPSFRQKVLTLPVRLEFDDKAHLSEVLNRLTLA